MGVKIVDRDIDRLCIIDDDENSRSGLVEMLYDTRFQSFAQKERVEDVDSYIKDFLKPSDAIISDHQLKQKNYFPINGAEIVSMCYSLNKPGILVTRYDKTQIMEIRRFRDRIPVILNPSEFEADTIYQSLEICIRELNGEIRADRKLWRTLVRVDSFDEHHIYIIIPGWDTTEVISVARKELPQEVEAVIDVDKRLHVGANIGCENPNDLYFSNWETK